MSNSDFPHISHERIDDQIRRSREDLNTLTFAHDYGFDATRYAMDGLGRNKFFEAVANQRAEMRLNGTITMDGEGNERRTATIDLAAMGLNAEAVAHIESLAAAEKARSNPAPAAEAKPAAVVATDDLLADRFRPEHRGLDWDAEGHGAARR